MVRITCNQSVCNCTETLIVGGLQSSSMRMQYAKCIGVVEVERETTTNGDERVASRGVIVVVVVIMQITATKCVYLVYYLVCVCNVLLVVYQTYTVKASYTFAIVLCYIQRTDRSALGRGQHQAAATGQQHHPLD